MRYHRFLPIVLLAVGTATVYAMAQQSSSSGSSSSSQSQSQGHGSASGSASASGYASAGGSQSGMATGNMQSGPATMYELDIEGDIDGAPVKLRTIVESRQTRNSVGSSSSYQSSSSSSSSLKNSESATIDSGLMKRNMDALRAYQTLRSRLIMKLPSTANLGQTWSADFKPVFDMRGGVVQYSYRRNERLEGVDCAQIEFKFMESEADDPGVVNGFIWIDRATTTVIRIDAKFHNLHLDDTRLMNGVALEKLAKPAK